MSKEARPRRLLGRMIVIPVQADSDQSMQSEKREALVSAYKCRGNSAKQQRESRINGSFGFVVIGLFPKFIEALY